MYEHYTLAFLFCLVLNLLKIIMKEVVAWYSGHLKYSFIPAQCSHSIGAVSTLVSAWYVIFKKISGPMVQPFFLYN